MERDNHAAVDAFVPEGSGAVRFHRQLAALLAGYEVHSFPATFERTPWRLRRLRPQHTSIIHSPPDLAVWVKPPQSALVTSFLNYVLDAEMRRHSTFAQRLHYRTDLRLFTKLAVRQAAVVTAVSHATAQLIREDLSFNGPIHVIPNSVDSVRFCPSAGPAPQRVLFCANPSRRKGFHWLNAIAKGIGDLAELACVTGSRDTIRSDHSHLKLLGGVAPEQLPDLYRSATVFVLPSIREGMSLAQLEAMATGLPVVAWRVPSSMELLGDVQDRLLAELGDVDGFVERVRWLLLNPEQALAIGARNRELMIRSHQPRQMAQAYADIFARLASASSKLRTSAE
jgi:glycosyltransferase involved in cell wall biosynthesis